MATETFEITIKGTSPLLQHRFTEAAENAKATRRISVDSVLPRDEASKCAYINQEGQLYIPTQQPISALINVAGNHKQRGSRKSLRYVVPGAVRPVEESAVLCDPDTGTPIKHFEVDSRPVTIPATKGKIMRHRPRIEKWSATFSLKINTDMIASDDVLKLLAEAGDVVGIGDFRPEKRGPFGCFIVTGSKKIR